MEPKCIYITALKSCYVVACVLVLLWYPWLLPFPLLSALLAAPLRASLALMAARFLKSFLGERQWLTEVTWSLLIPGIKTRPLIPFWGCILQHPSWISPLVKAHLGKWAGSAKEHNIKHRVITAKRELLKIIPLSLFLRGVSLHAFSLFMPAQMSSCWQWVSPNSSHGWWQPCHQQQPKHFGQKRQLH